MKKNWNLHCIFFISILFFLFSGISVTRSRANFTLNWSQNTPIPYKIASQASQSIGDYIFVFGGSAVSGQSHAETLNSVLGIDDVLDVWSETTAYPKRLIWHTSASTSQYVYVLGGLLDGIGGVSGLVDDVYVSEINNPGTLGPWIQQNKLPKLLALGGAGVVGNFIYHVGGENDSAEAVDDVYFAPINGDGSLGNWSSTSSLPLPSVGITVVTYGNNIYAVGRRFGTQVFTTKANVDGTLQPWSSANNLLRDSYRASITRVGKSIFVIGGIDDSSQPSNDVQFTTINDDGSLQTWEEKVDGFPRRQCCSPAVEANGRIFVVGGHDGSGYFSEVWSSNVLVESTPTPLPSPTPSPTLTPTPTPTQIPVTKTILVPGIGGSWNQDAILNCKAVNYVGEWNLSPFADRVYEPFINAMHLNKKYIYPFYYDWRKDARESATRLREYVAGLTLSGEKVDVVGHSFGGLVARAYAKDVGNSKIRKLMLVGTPNQGTTRAYPAWSGAEVWNGNPIFAIAQSLVIQRCGGVGALRRQVLRTNFPAIQNLLPTFDYLRGWLNSQLKPVNSMEAKNNWLPEEFNSPWQGVTVGTLAGTGKKTVFEIKVHDPSVVDILMNIWNDGKPISTKKSTEGDDTVLVNSAQAIDADNRVSNQSHIGIMSRKNAIEEILDFLGPTPIVPLAGSDTSEIQTALVVTSPDSEIALTDKAGKITKSRDGILVIPNPKKNTYTIRLSGVGKNRKISVGQFLKDEKVLWKDYGFSKATEWRGKLNFDDVNPKEDVLR